jgi:hypothetical protein
VRLAVVGSVSFRNPDITTMADTLVIGTMTRYRYEIELVVSGGAVGIDTVGETWADVLGLPKRIHLPENRRWKPDGFEKRNLKIVDDCTHLLCVRDKYSKTYRSGWTADRAQEKGKVVWRYDI